MEQQIQQIPLGNLTGMKYSLTNPENFNLKFTDMKSILILVGQNGTGKTMHMTMCWCINTLAGLRDANKASSVHFKQLVTNIFKYAFVDLPLQGSIHAKYGDNMDFNIVFEEGTVTSCTFTEHKENLGTTGAIYLSKNTRTYTDINKYYQVKTMLDIDYRVTPAHFLQPSDEIKKLSTMYRNYDVIFMDTYKERFLTRTPLPEGLKEQFSTPSNYKEIEFLQHNGVKMVGLTASGMEVSLETLTAGEQSILVMFSTTNNLNN